MNEVAIEKSKLNGQLLYITQLYFHAFLGIISLGLLDAPHLISGIKVPYWGLRQYRNKCSSDVYNSV